MTTFIIFFVIGFILSRLILSATGVTSIKSRRKPKELGGNMEPSENNDEPLACDMLVTRVFEQRMVDAGIMTVAEMSVCENYGKCDDCMPTFHARVKIEKERTLREQMKKDALMKAKMKELNDIKPQPASKSAKQGEMRLHINHQGREATFDWPRQIPTFASVSVDGASPYNDQSVTVMFKWTDPDTGSQMGHKVMFPMLQWEPPKNADPVHRTRMTHERRAKAVESLTRKPTPPSGKGGGSPKDEPRGSENYYWLKEPGKAPRLVDKRRGI